MSTWDENKRSKNLAKHGVDFADAIGFEWGAALTAPDARQAYGEERFVSIGFVGPRLHVLVWTMRNDEVRFISFRKANKREVRCYVEAIG